jgi:hypothetical protein
VVIMGSRGLGGMVMVVRTVLCCWPRGEVVVTGIVRVVVMVIITAWVRGSVRTGRVNVVGVAPRHGPAAAYASFPLQHAA